MLDIIWYLFLCLVGNLGEGKENWLFELDYKLNIFLGIEIFLNFKLFLVKKKFN